MPTRANFLHQHKLSFASANCKIAETSDLTPMPTPNGQWTLKIPIVENTWSNPHHHNAKEEWEINNCFNLIWFCITFECKDWKYLIFAQSQTSWNVHDFFFFKNVKVEGASDQRSNKSPLPSSARLSSCPLPHSLVVSSSASLNVSL